MKKIEKKMTEAEKRKWFNAIRKNDIKTIKKMLKEGIDVNLQDSSGWTALHLASSFGYIDISKCLIYNRADVNAKDDIGWTPLHVACYWGKTEMAKLLIDNGANFTKNKDGNTPLDRLKSYLDRLKSYQQHHEELMEWLSEEYPEKMLEYMSKENSPSKGIGL